MESIEEIVARVQSTSEAKERQAFEDLISDLREWHSTGYEFWTFDLSMDQAVERVRKFIEER